METVNRSKDYRQKQLTVVTVTGEDRRNGDGSPVIDRHCCISTGDSTTGLSSNVCLFNKYLTTLIRPSSNILLSPKIYLFMYIKKRRVLNYLQFSSTS